MGAETPESVAADAFDEEPPVHLPGEPIAFDIGRPRGEILHARAGLDGVSPGPACERIGALIPSGNEKIARKNLLDQENNCVTVPCTERPSWVMHCNQVLSFLDNVTAG